MKVGVVGTSFDEHKRFRITIKNGSPGFPHGFEGVYDTLDQLRSSDGPQSVIYMIKPVDNSFYLFTQGRNSSKVGNVEYVKNAAAA